MSKTILDLPPELIANIFQYADNRSFLAGRLGNRHLEQASFTVFGRRFFRKKGYMITSSSLDVLQHVASHEKLRLHVQHVWFNPDCYTFGPPLHPLGFFDETDEGNASLRNQDKYSDDPVVNRRRHEAHFACAHDHAEIIKSERALADRLEHAFASMPNLKTVGMRRSTDYNPWGWSRLRDAVGRDPRELGAIRLSSTSDLSGPTLLYIALIQSLAASGSEVRRFYTDAIELDQITLEALPLETIQRACKSVLYLEVNATKSRPDLGPGDGNRYGSGIANLLVACPKLRELGFAMLHQGGHYVRYPHLVFVHLAEKIRLQTLRRIKFENLITGSSELLSVLQPASNNLTSVKLRNIRLLMLDTTIEEPYPATPWKPIFSFLAFSCPKLSYLFLHKASTNTGSVRFVQNLPSPPPGQDPDSRFTDYDNITVEVGVPHNDPDAEGSEKRAAIFRAREAVNRRMRTLVDGHWHGRMLYSYDMDERVWHTDTSDEDW